MTEIREELARAAKAIAGLESYGFKITHRQYETATRAEYTAGAGAIEGKYQNLVEVVNMLHIFMSSNSDWVVPAAIDERRFCVTDVADNRIGDRAYFRHHPTDGERRARRADP